MKVFKQYLKLIRHFGTLGPQKARLSITGGEPLVRSDLLLLLKKIYKYNKYFSLTIFSNGSLITKDNAEKMKSLGIKQVQVSLDGLEKNNDFIRGDGAYQKTIKAITTLVALNISVTVSMTLTKHNLSDVPVLIKLCNKLGVRALGVRRLVPIGRGRQLMDDMLSPRELKEFYIYIQEEKNKKKGKKQDAGLIHVSRGCEEGIFSQEIKQDLSNCAILDGRCMVVLHNGDVVPCRRLPMKIGNALDEDLIKIYYSSDKLKQLRNLNNASKLCMDCIYFDRCLSGAKCISNAYFDKISVPDPQCWKLFKNLPDPDLFKDTKDKVSKSQRVHLRLLPINKDGQ